MAGPIASAMTNKYGCRGATIFGTVLASSGFVASYFATSLDYLILSLGIVSGFGFSLIYMSAIVVVAFYCKYEVPSGLHAHLFLVLSFHIIPTPPPLPPFPTQFKRSAL